MINEYKKKVWVGGVYNWSATSTKEERRRNNEYPRHNWCDIDTFDTKFYESVIKIFQENEVNCIGQKCGRGFHVWGDLVSFDLWLKIWNEIRPFADPRWPPHTIRITKKRQEEIWEKPIFHKHESDPKPWSRSLMHFLCKTLRNENSENIWNAMHQVGLHKYLQVTVYPVELRI